MSKYGWDEEPIETNPSASDTVENTVNPVDDRATPKIEIEEILNVPEEAINKDYKVLKETDAVEEKIEALEATQESLRQIYKHIQQTGKVSVGTHHDLKELAPDISLESANMYTSVPSENQAEETEVALRNTISANEVIMAGVAGDLRITAAKNLFFGGDKSEAERLAYIDKIIAQVADGGFRRDQAIKAVRDAIVNFVRDITSKIEAAKKDQEAVAGKDENIFQMVTEHIDQLTATREIFTNESELINWFKRYMSPDQQRLLFSMEEELGRYSNIAYVLKDYVTDRKVYNITETHEQKAHNRVCHQLDEINQWITDTANAIINGSPIPEDTQYSGKASLENYISVNSDVDKFDISSVYLKPEVFEYEPLLDVLESSTEAISECIKNNTHFMNAQFKKIINYINFYCNDLLPVLDGYVKSRKDIFTAKEEQIISDLYSNIRKLVTTLSANLVKDVTVYVGKRNYFLGVMAGYQIVFSTLSDVVDTWIKNNEEFPDSVYDSAQRIKEASDKALEIFANPVMTIK